MAFKCVRDFAEHLKILGYQEPIPLSILNTINGNAEVFKVYANILLWLIKCLDPDFILPSETRTENDRVLLIRSATEFLAVSAGIKLNPRKLYSSTSATSKELLKITTMLLNSPKEDTNSENEHMVNFEESFSNDQINVIRKIRGLSTELTTMGVTMFDLISKETNNREMRLQYSNLPLELNYVEKSIKQAIAAMKTQLTNAMVGLESNNSEISNLNMKIQRKQSELLRNKQRFNTLQKIRPAYLEEFEKIEESLKELYVQYSVRIQTLNALKSFVVSFNTPTSVSPMNKVQDSSIPILPEEDLTDSNDEEEEPSEDDVIFKDESLQQDLLKQVSSRLKSRNEKKSLDSKIGKLDELTISESSNESDELEGSELEFIMDLNSEETERLKFKRENTSSQRMTKAEISDEDF